MDSQEPGLFCVLHPTLKFAHIRYLFRFIGKSLQPLSAVGCRGPTPKTKFGTKWDEGNNHKKYSFALVILIMPLRKGLHWNRGKIQDRVNISPEGGQRMRNEPERSVTAEEKSRIELEKLQKVIEDRKRIARDTDVSYHLWELYKSYFRGPDPQSLHQVVHDGEWYDVKTLKVSTRNGLNEFEFELQGRNYKFVDDEERQGWRENLKYFSLFLYDDSDRCLIEIPMRMRVDSDGRDYAILLDGPRAFLPGHWINDFINVRLKHQSIRNREIRSKKHQDRLREIEDLKTRFGIVD